jgi:hypothetical protein
LKTRLLTATLLAAVALPMLHGVQADADQTVDCNGSFPIFDSTALSEEENQARIACIEDRRQAHVDAIRKNRAENAEYSERIQALKRAKARNRELIQKHKRALAPLNEVGKLLRYVAGYIAWLNSTSTCESHNDPQAHSASGTYHGKLQFSLTTWRSLQWAAKYGNDDPHTEPAIVQDAGGVELLKRSGDEQWPRCGD